MRKVGIISRSLVEIMAIKEGFAVVFPEEKFHFQVFHTPIDLSLESFVGADELCEATINRISRVREESVSKPDFCVAFIYAADYTRDTMAQFVCVVVQSKNEVGAQSTREELVVSLFKPTGKIFIFQNETAGEVSPQTQEIYRDSVSLALLCLPPYSPLDGLI